MATIHVADDEPALRELLTEALETEGHDVHAFPDGPSLLEVAFEDPPDVILLDINMPGISGWHVKERLDEDDRTAGVPVIAVTARGGDSIERSARDGLGFTAFVQKPFRLQELMATIENALGVAP